MADPTRDQLVQLRRNVVELESKLDRKGVQNLIERFDVVELIAEIDQPKLETIRCLAGGGSKVLATTLIITVNPEKSFVRDMAKESNWKLLSDAEYKAGTTTYELAEFLKQGESYVKGDVMAGRAKEIGADLGQKHAEFLLENQNLIPEDYRKFYLVFPGTIWRDSGGGRRVPYLGWNGKQWYLCFYWLDDDWLGNDRLLRPRK